MHLFLSVMLQCSWLYDEKTVVPVRRYTASALVPAVCVQACVLTHTSTYSSTEACAHTRAAALTRTFSSPAVTMMDVEGSTSRLLSQTWRQKSWIKTRISHPLLSFSLSSCFSQLPHDCQNPAHPPIHSLIFFTAHQSIPHYFPHCFSHSNNDLWIRAGPQRFTSNISRSILCALRCFQAFLLPWKHWS